jgi:hypothetical protein
MLQTNGGHGLAGLHLAAGSLWVGMKLAPLCGLGEKDKQAD